MLEDDQVPGLVAEQAAFEEQAVGLPQVEHVEGIAEVPQLACQPQYSIQVVGMESAVVDVTGVKHVVDGTVVARSSSRSRRPRSRGRGPRSRPQRSPRMASGWPVCVGCVSRARV